MIFNFSCTSRNVYISHPPNFHTFFSIHNFFYGVVHLGGWKTQKRDENNNGWTAEKKNENLSPRSYLHTTSSTPYRQKTHKNLTPSFLNGPIKYIYAVCDFIESSLVHLFINIQKTHLSWGARLIQILMVYKKNSA